MGSKNTKALDLTQDGTGWLRHEESPVEFVELLARSNFSFLQGASHPEEMVETAIQLGYQGISICDLNGLYGVVRGFNTVRSPSHFTASVHASEDFRYHFGTELTLVEEISLVLTPINKMGYHRLCEILTLGKRQAAKGFSRLSLADICQNTEGLLAYLILNSSADDSYFFRLQEAFRDRLYLPVWRDLTWESREIYKKALRLEQTARAQLFATNRPFMHISERKALFDVVTCIHHHRKIDEAADILIQNSERHLKPIDELKTLWKDRWDLLHKTVEISDKIEFSLYEIRYRYPQSRLPQGQTPADYLRDLVYQGLYRKKTVDPAPRNFRSFTLNEWSLLLGEVMIKIVEHELKIIKDLEYEDYFLTLKEICQFADQKNILYQGRGSAANSVVCYGLGLTAIDPVQMNLLFERFISMERREPPDIDIDFEHERREEVIQHIYEKYDEQHAAMVCTVIRFRSRMAFREVAKVFGLELSKINSMVKFMGRDGVRRLEDPESCDRFLMKAQQMQMILGLAKELMGFPRHLGIHTGGFLITQDPITEMVPVEKATMQGRYVIQWNKDDVNTLRLMKIDILSLGMLTALRKAFAMINRHKGTSLELYNLPIDDSPTYDMICKAETVGVFQIESRAQMNTLPRLQPRTFYDLVIEVALVRPGPLQGGMVHPFLKRRQGKEKTFYAHPDLEPILGKTMGVPIFQEQVMKVVVAVAGFTPGESDELRRIMSSAWRKKGTMEGIQQKIMQGMKKHGIKPEYAEQIYRTIEGFANYGFPESHAASFALLTYASSYIKHHYPDVFAASLLNSQPMGFYPPRVIVNEAQKNGVHFLPLDINQSEYDYELESFANPSSEEKSQIFDPKMRKGEPLHAVRVGFLSLYGVSENILRQILQERSERGVFKNFKDFVQRCHLPKVVLMKLAASGAMRSFGENVRELLWKIESTCLDRESFLWGESQIQSNPQQDRHQIPFESQWELMIRETHSKGYSLENHPMKIVRSIILKKNEAYRKLRFVAFVNSRELERLPHKAKVRVAGLRSIMQKPPTAKGMTFITLEDEFGFMNLVIPPDVYQRERILLYSHSFFHACGRLEHNGPVRNIKVERIYPLIESEQEMPQQFGDAY